MALPHLVKAANAWKLLTYGELAQKIDTHHRAINHVLGYIRDEICIPRNLPLINAIVINAGNDLPGKSWLPEGTDHLSDEEYEQKFIEFRDEVFSFTGWEDLLHELGLKPLENSPTDLNEIGRAYTDVLSRRGSGGEGERHLKLKEYVASNPKEIGLPETSIAEMEYHFISGDFGDVVFDLGEGNWAVAEIKNGQQGELVKGVYQAIKYQALLKAEKGQGKPCSVDAVLVAYSIPSEIQFFAAQFGIRCKITRVIPE